MLDNQPNISVIIPTYNRVGYVTRAIDSVLAQTYTDYEIIVIDDGSTDNTREVLQPYKDRIRYIYQENAGVSAARNAGIQAAKGEWISLLDSDDEWLPEKLSVQIKEVGKEASVCLHTTNAIMSREYAQAVNLFRFTNVSEQLNGDPCIIERPLVYQIKYGLARPQCTLIKRKTLIDIGLFDTQLTIYEDQDLMCRLALEDAWVVSNRELVCIHRRDELTTNLSEQRISDPVHSHKTLVYIYDKLSKDKKLSPDEKRLVKKKLSSCRTGLGMELLNAGQKITARESLRLALAEQKTPKSLLRYLLSFLPSYVTTKIVRNWHRLRYDKHRLILYRNGGN